MSSYRFSILIAFQKGKASDASLNFREKLQTLKSLS